MTKMSFLKKLAKALETLSEEERDEILEKYEKIIDEEVKRGKKQRDIIQGLGDIRLIAQLYVEHQAEEIKKPYGTKRMVDSILSNIDQVFEHIDGIKAKLILELICFASIGFLILALVGIPFQLIHFLLNVTFYFVSSNIYLYQTVRFLLSIGLLALYGYTVVWFVADYIKSVIQYIRQKYEL